MSYFRERKEGQKNSLETVVLSIKSVCKTVTGGRRKRFSVLAIAGDKKGLIGYGNGKSTDIQKAIRMAENTASSRTKKVSLLGGYTFSHNVSEILRYKSSFITKKEREVYCWKCSKTGFETCRNRKWSM